MSFAMLKQNSKILLEVAQNYDKILESKKTVSKEEIERIQSQEKNFKNQFLYLLTSINKLIQEEKNAK